MNILENRSDCCGCGACYNRCPTKAISMRPDEEGFLFPHIDETKCIECHLCQKVCPINNPRYENSMQPKIIAGVANDEIRAKSSSGGMFTLYARYFIEQGGYVCGAAFDENFCVKHIVCNDEAGLEKMRRSKYVQSDTALCYTEIEKLLKNGKQVMFTGTPCQVAGLKAFLGKDYDNLFTVDLLCHGTPSPKAFEIWKSQVAKSREFTDIDFRKKENGLWDQGRMSAEYDNNEAEIYDIKNSYKQAFLSFYMQRYSCYSCRFSRLPRQGDISIGDFWGIDNYKKVLNDKKGISVVFCNSSKGKTITELVNESTKFIVDDNVPLSVVAAHNIHIYRKPKPHPGRANFIKNLIANNSFEQSIQVAQKEKYDIGLLTFYYANNYGAALTSYALYKVVEEMGYSTVLLDVPYDAFPGNNTVRDNELFSRRFINNHCQVTNPLKNIDDVYGLNNQFKCFLVGSDQLWRTELISSASVFYFLNFVSDDKKKIAYATSTGGGPLTGDACDIAQQKYLLRKFDAVSVREEQTVDYLAKECFVSADLTLDPVFLCDKKYYEKCVAESTLTTKGYLLGFFIINSPEKEEATKKLAAELNLTPIIIVARQRNTVEDWLYYVKNSDLVLTDSFHGYCFSLIFHVPFCVITKGRAGKQRYSSLANIVGYQNRIFAEIPQIFQHIDDLKSPIDFDEVDKKLSVHKERSLKWLEEALRKPKSEFRTDAQRMINRRLDDLENRLIAMENAAQQNISVCSAQDIAALKKALPKRVDLNAYFNYLSLYKKRVIVVLSTKDEPSKQWLRFTAGVDWGVSMQVAENFRGSYIGVLDWANDTVINRISKEEIHYNYQTAGRTISINSGGYRSEKDKGLSEIKIGNFPNISPNLRGLNVAVLARETLEVIDAFNVDCFGDKNLFIKRVPT